MTATERNTNNELTRLIVALVLLSASLAAWADMAFSTNYTYDAVGQLVGTASGYGTDGAPRMTRDYAYDLHGWPVKLDTKVTRGFNPIFLSWDSADRYADKYAGTSPWIYCGSNPIMNIDFSGDTIQVMVGETTYSWQEKEGNWGFASADVSVYDGGDVFANQLCNALTTIMGGPRGEKIISILSAYKENVIIKNGNKSSARRGYNVVNWNPEGVGVPTVDGFDKNGISDLAHELGHVIFDCASYEQKDFLEIQAELGPKTLSVSELYATHIENIVRGEMDIPLRSHYTYDKYSGEKILPLLQPDGKTSLYFDTLENTTYGPIKPHRAFIYRY